ncbi:MOSC domain-containing protein [Niveispirillum sp. KHB5.9]|uniref:MOSC domain-containing protein n=1 Tax=Niveispirillum sp. KHB5.9 TaxID=3400269 RepID=UPI003A86ECC7
MKLLNFSAGKVRTFDIGGQPVPTGHVKTPITGPWIIDENGAVGDERAVHPDKLYAFSHAGYRYWADHLQTDRDAWPDGFFGENLTFDSLDEEEIRVGDEFTLGDEVRLFVTGARTACAKLAWRVSQPMTFLQSFSLSKRVGAYLGIIATGRVRQGDALVRTRSDPEMPTLAELCRYIHHRDIPPLEPLRRVLGFAGLSPTARLLLGAKLEAAERAAATAGGGWRGWRPFVLDDIREEEAPEIRSFHLRPVDGGKIAQPVPGQFVTVRMGAEAVTRSWSLSDFVEAPESYRLTVKRQQGPGSNFLHAAKVGDTVDLRAPAGSFVLDMGSIRPIALVAAGIGITPLYAMLRAHVTRSNPAPAQLFYGARTAQEAALRGEIDGLAASVPGVTVHYCFSREPGCPPSRITADQIIDRMDGQQIDLHGKIVKMPWFEGEFYLCGPADFCQSLKQELVARGGNANRIHFELFSAPDAVETDLEVADVRFAHSGKAARWSADSELSLLELAEQAGVEAAFDCRAGACQTCRTKIIDGKATAMVEEAALICIARPSTPVLVLDL